MRLVDSRTGLVVLERDEAVRLLTTQEIGRLGFVSGGSMEVLPVNYVMDGDAVVFATAAGVKLSRAVGASVVFEVDHTDPVTRSGWSVVLRGIAAEVTEFDRRELVARVRSLPLQPWAQHPKPHLVRIEPVGISGRRVVPSGP